jgi:hypothetical protein
MLSRFLSVWLEMSVPPSESKQSFLALCHAHSILQFGTFTVKSGRISPYFFNAGSFCTAFLLSALGDAYARTIIDACAPSDSGVSIMPRVIMHLQLLISCRIEIHNAETTRIRCNIWTGLQGYPLMRHRLRIPCPPLTSRVRRKRMVLQSERSKGPRGGWNASWCLDERKEGPGD